MPRNIFDHTHLDDCMKMHFLDQTRLSTLSESKFSHQKPGRSPLQTPPGCHGLTCPRALAHRILDPVSSPIQQWNREDISNAMIIVRQSVSETLSPWCEQCDKPFFSYWNLTGIHALNTITIMYGPYRHRGHVGALDHANIAVNNRPGIQRDSLHILYFARKSPQTAAPSPMYSPDIKEQMLQRKIKSETSNFLRVL